MVKSLNLIHRIAPALVLIVAFLFIGILTVKANPSFFARTTGGTCGVVTATSTLAYMTAGTATTSVVFDAACGGSGSMDSATLLIQLTASTTNSVLAVNYEYSQGGNGNDCVASPNSCDWYQDNTTATSTANPIIGITAPTSLTWTFASTTQGLAASTGNRQLKAVSVKTPMRYVRALFSVPILSTGLASSSAVWAEFVGKRQVQ